MRLGHNCTGKIDAYVGQQTQQALAKFQQSRDLLVDGAVGPDTQAQMMQDIREQQEFLNGQGFVCPVDGDYGYQTEQAMREWQVKCGLVGDGVIGRKTRDAMEAAGLRSSFSSEESGTTPASGMTSNPLHVYVDDTFDPEDDQDSNEEEAHLHTLAAQRPTYKVIFPVVRSLHHEILHTWHRDVCVHTVQ